MFGSSRAKRSAVKAHDGKTSKERGFARHLEGWQPGVLAVFLAGSSALIAVPRPVEPRDVPEPTISPRALAEAARTDEALAEKAEAENAAHAPLDYDVRALGSAIREYGLADAEGDDPTVMQARARVAEAAKKARAQGEAPLLELRAYQTRAFLRALRRWEAKGDELPELRELGGGFVSMAGRNGWVNERGLLMDEPVRRAMFKKRWNDIALTRGPGFDLTSDEQRAILRFLIRHPPREDAEIAVGARIPRAIKDSERKAYLRDQYLLRKIEELATLDPGYPADLARGVIFFRMHRYGAAKEAFGRWLDSHESGPFVVRAQNWLAAAAEHAGDGEP